MTSKWKQLLAAAAVSVLVAACGGGGGGDESAAPLPPPDAANEYVGTWVMGCTTDGTNSRNESFTLTKTGARELRFTFEGVRYVGPGCSGGAQPAVNSTGTITLDSEATASYQGNTVTFDQITATIDGIASPSVEKWTAAVLPSGRLLIDFEDTPATAGYPTQPNDGSTEYTRQ
jgi:hypothetical protein